MLHPAKKINDKYPNKQFHDRLDDLLVIGRDERRVHGKNQNVILFRHIDFGEDDVVLYCAPRFAKVTVEGPQEQIFDKEDDRNDGGTGGNGGIDEADDDPVEVPTVDRYGNHAEDVARLLAEGYDVDDDNAPAPENIPNRNDSSDDNFTSFDGWGSRMYCIRTSEGHKFEKPKVSRQPMDNKRLEWFLLFLPVN